MANTNKSTERLLELKDVRTSFFTHLGEIQAVRGVSYTVNKGEAIGIVGESGSGKSISSMSIMRLIQDPGKIKSGEIIFKDKDLLKLSKKEVMNIRGNEIAMIFQDPMTSLNPVHTIGNQIMESILRHQKVNKAEAREKAIEILELVGIPSAKSRLKAYPHEFSGGMRQRVMIAIALSCKPDLLIADEPTTALDVTIQAQILDLMKDLKDKLNTSIILITHDLGVVADLCSKILVMYGGMIMEQGTAEEIFYEPKHPYTIGLLRSIPKPTQQEKLIPIEGSPPDLLRPPKGCAFASRCEWAMNICFDSLPPYFETSKDHRVSCWLHDKDAPKINLKGGVRNETK